jgi:hypothetical protein
MNLKTGTKIRILAASLLLAATALGGMSGPSPVKNATGCSRSDHGGLPTAGGCEYGGDGCYDCIYSDRYGYKRCYEYPDGSIAGCEPWSPDMDDPWGW